MYTKDLVNATKNFNPNYRCFFEFNKKNLPLSKLKYDKERNILILFAENGIALKVQDISIICQVSNPESKIVCSYNSILYPIFGFRIVNRKKLFFA